MQTPNPVEHRPDGTSVLTLTYKGQQLLCVIDTADYPLVKDYRWFPRIRQSGGVDVQTTFWKSGKRINLRLHRLLCPDSASVDHCDGQPLNNVRSNLRLASRTQQAANTRKPTKGRGSKYKGVSKDRNRFRAIIEPFGKKISLGTFDTETEAAIAYNTAAKKYFGEFARLNEIDEIKPVLGLAA